MTATVALAPEDGNPLHESFYNKICALLDCQGAVKAELILPGQSAIRRARQILMRESLLMNAIQSLLLREKVVASECMSPMTGNSHLLNKNRLHHLNSAIQDELHEEIEMIRAMQHGGQAIPSSHTEGFDPDTDSSRVGILGLSRELTGDLEQFIQSGDRFLKLLASQTEYTRAGQVDRALIHLCEYLENLAVALSAKSKMNARLFEVIVYEPDLIHALRRIAQEIALIEKNLEGREHSIHNSIERYRSCGQSFRRISEEYLGIHADIVQCEKEIDRLLYQQSMSNPKQAEN